MRFETLETERLILLPMTDCDEKYDSELARLLNDKDIYEHTESLPYPYTEVHARAYVSGAKQRYEKGMLDYIILLKETSQLVGGIAFAYQKSNRSGALSFWTGTEFWNRGYCSEATKQLIFHAFTSWEVNRIFGYHFLFNKGSEKVMQKNGMKFEGLLREYKYKRGQFYDVGLYAILKSDFEKTNDVLIEK